MVELFVVVSCTGTRIFKYSSNPKFVYQGNGRVKECEDTKPVKNIWGFINENEEYPN
ncbi:hypothetical protein [Sporosarcina sp. FA9]|uniref:hypothetical protein n=1 Tax=Sporosarcina sp. FA9 TaxID=3413030 RepID=UPI003F654CEB